MIKKQSLLFITLSILLTLSLSNVTAQSDSATYTVTFNATWSEATHPHPSGAFPGTAHFSGLVGAVHNENVSFWEVGGMATDGIKRMAETGGKALLVGEVETAITAGTASTAISENGADSPDTLTFTIDVDTVNPLVTIVTMIAPSPDWFVGVSGLSLRSGDEWVPSHTVDLFPYDAGTDDGEDYTSGNMETDPRSTIESLTGVSPLSAEAIGTLTFELSNSPTAVTMQNGTSYTSNTLLLLIVLTFVSIITSAVIAKR